MDTTTETFQTDVIERSRELAVVVEFRASWCGPCAMGEPTLEGVVAAHAGTLELVAVDVESQAALADRYGVLSVPTVVVFRDGRPVIGFSGTHPAGVIEEFIDEHVIAGRDPALMPIDGGASELPLVRPRGGLGAPANGAIPIVRHIPQIGARS